MSSILFGDTIEDAEIHWCPRMPSARTFPNNFFTAFPWDLRDTCVKFLDFQTQIAISKNMQYKHHLLDVAQFLSLFPDIENSSLGADFLSPLWVGRRRQKSKLSRWERSALKLSNCKTVRSVTAKPISFWIQLTAEDIKKSVSPPKSTKRQFLWLHKYFLSVLRSIGRHLEASDHNSLPHLPEVQWSEDIPICSSCSGMLNFVQSPDKIHRPCFKPHSIRKAFFLRSSTRAKRSFKHYRPTITILDYSLFEEPKCSALDFHDRLTSVNNTMVPNIE